ncbi:MAG: rhomboid family intramembrane serine protease [Pseudomonadota bacterium]
MFPIRDHNPSGRQPIVVYMLIVANIGVFLSYVGNMDDLHAMHRFFFHWAIIPARLSDGVGFETLLTSMFLHGGWIHLAGNMLFLWIFGDNLEDEMGHVPFLIFYVACGASAGLLHVFSAPHSIVPAVGASGAIAGVMGGYLLLFPRARVDVLLVLVVFFRIFTIPSFIMLGVWLVMQFIGSLTSNPDEGGVAYWAHTGGFATGLILCVPLWLRRGGRAYWTRTGGHPPHPEYSPSRIPRISRRGQPRGWDQGRRGD